MIHESVTITVLPPSAVCAGEGGREGGERVGGGESGRRREEGGEGGKGREEGGEGGKGREEGGEREGERGREREGEREGERERERDSQSAPERGTNVPDTNLSMSLNSRFTESATCLEGITTNNQTKQQLVLSTKDDCLCMCTSILTKLQRFNTLTVGLYLHGCCSWVSWDMRGCLLHPSRDQWSATPTPSRREERDRTQRRWRNREGDWEDNC